MQHTSELYPFADDSQVDFADLLDQSLELEQVERGDILMGTVLAIDRQGVIIDVGLKRDGVVPRSDLDSLGSDYPIKVGQKIMVMVVKPEDRDGNLIVSIHQARAMKDWEAAQQQMDDNEIYVGEVIAANRGGLIVPYGELRGFVPASHVLNMPRGLDDEARAEYLSHFVGKKLELKIIEVNPRRRRLVLSQREAQQEMRNQAKEQLMSSLQEGAIVRGKVSSLRDFGAFIDLGGADGLVHVSEMAWRRIRHPSEVLSIGMEVEAYVLQLDPTGNRISLSLKRLQPNPWIEIGEKYALNQIVEGVVTRMATFGAFVELPNGIEALLHTSQMGDPPPRKPEEAVSIGQRITARIITLEPHNQRMGLSLKGIETREQEQATSVSETLDDLAVDDTVAEADTI